MDEQAIFAAALERRDPDERALFLDEACGENRKLRRRIDRLLAAHAAVGGFMATSPVGDAGMVPITEGPGSVIGPYTLVEEIGEGGFGIVYVAEQTTPVRRRVALKIVKPGMDTREVVARFQVERQALALMDHPHIARVFDAGATDTGRPYFVMELVKGVPIAEYCDRSQVAVTGRLRLFVQVCRAVQHAHQKGVIHRDLKPGNVLVAIQDGRAEPRIIDFGVAKATAHRLTEHTFRTRFAQMVGTPQYMSPEQAELSPLDVDTRTDIYSLGVLLYELLTGTTPLERERLKDITFDKLRRIIREEDPPTPSTRITGLNGPSAEIAAARRTDPRRLAQTVRGDLDWITMKALEKDRARRYETANAFARDVERFLRDEPVEARPPSVGYRVHKFVRRNRRSVTLSLVFLALVVAVGGFSLNRLAEQHALEREIVAALDEAEGHLRRDSIPEAISATKRAESLLAGRSVDDTIAQRFRSWKRDLAMAERLEAVLLQTETSNNEEGFDLAATASAYAAAFREYGLDLAEMAPGEAAKRIRDAEIRRQLLAGLHDWSLMEAGLAIEATLVDVAERADDDPWRRRLLRAYLKDEPVKELVTHEEVLKQPTVTIRLLCIALARKGEFQTAVDILRKVRVQRPGDFWIHFNLGFQLGNLDPRPHKDVVACYRAALAIRPESAAAHNQLAMALWEKGDAADAVSTWKEAIRLAPGFLNARNNLANALVSRNELAEAEELARKTVELRPRHAVSVATLAFVVSKRKSADAIDIYREALEIDPDFLHARFLLALLLDQAGRVDEAIIEYTELARRGHLEPRVYLHLGSIFTERGELEKALEVQRQALKLVPEAAWPHHNMGLILAEQGKLEEALESYREAIRRNAKHVPAQFALGRTLAGLQRFDEAKRTLRALQASQPKMMVQLRVARAFSQMGEWKEALALHGNVRARAPNNPMLLNEAAWWLVTCPEQFRDAAEAVALAKQAAQLNDKDGNTWNTLGLALYRNGEYAAAVDALNRSVTLGGGSAFDWFFLAMAQHRLQKPKEAREAFDRAVASAAKQRSPNAELVRFRAEAAALLGTAQEDG